jgi:hypothetical protein
MNKADREERIARVYILRRAFTIGFYKAGALDDLLVWLAEYLS